MGDMPCVWCLYFLTACQYGDSYAESPAEPGIVRTMVRTWADADDAIRSGLVVRDRNGDRCGLNSQTLVSGDAVCLGHAVAVLRSRGR